MPRPPERVLLLLPTTSYKAPDFLRAAARLGVEVVVGTDRRQALESEAPGNTLTVDLVRPERSVRRIVASAAERPYRAVLGVDDETVILAARAAAALGLAHNSVDSVRACRDKHETRRRLAAAGLRSPGCRKVPVSADPAEVARDTRFPCVLKPLGLSASRGVLRADDARSFAAAFARVAAILREPDVRRRGGDTEHLLVEDYWEGREVALEALLEAGRLRPLALFDKPDPLQGPTFEETLFVTPSRLPVSLQRDVAREAERGCAALGLVEGPVHAELRVDERGPWLIEVAPRTIGGLCSRALRFGSGTSLEELVLLHAIGRDSARAARSDEASGVMMIPTPRRGVLEGVEGIEAAREVPGIVQVEIAVHRGAELVPLPEGHRYLGFLFARGPSAEQVEQSLRRAHARLRLRVR